MGFLDSLKGIIGLGTIKEGLFSELFPKTFEYLKKFVPSKYPDFKEEIPDVKVVVREKSRKDIMADATSSGCAIAMYYIKENEIVVHPAYLSENKQVILRLIQDPELLCKFMDARNEVRSILVHEYQHFLQYTLDKGKNEVRINLPEGLHAIDGEKAYAKIYFELKKSKVCNLFAAGVIVPLFSLIGLPGFIGSTVATYGMQYHNLRKSIALRKQYPKEAKLGSFQLYLFKEEELEAQLAEKVYGAVLGKDPSEFSNNFKVTEERLRLNVETLKAGIEEQKGLYDEVDGKEKREITKRLKLMEDALYKEERSLKLIPLVNEEVDRIAENIKRKMAEESKRVDGAIAA